MSVLAAALIDQAKLVSNNRRNAAIADTDWIVFINWAVESWYKFRTALDPALYFSQTATITLTGGAGAGSSIDLTNVANFPAPGLRSLHGVDLYPDTGQRMTIRSRNFQQRNDGVGPWLPGPFCPVRKYDVRAFSLVITPYENASGPYRLYYRANPYKFSGPADATPLDAVLEPETEAIVLLSACSAFGIEETAQDPWTKRIGIIKAETEAIYERDDGAAGALADVEDMGSGWGGAW